MAEETGIGWTDATANFIIGCAPAGPGCDGCYAAAFSHVKFGIEFEPGGERRETKSGFADPLKWHRMRVAGKKMRRHGQEIDPPLWVFACSLSDFFDKEWPADVRKRAWAVIKECSTLRWQIVTKRVGLVERYLPDDWNGGKGYEHVGIIATMVNQDEVVRDMPKLVALKRLGVKWIGTSCEPQIGPIEFSTDHMPNLDWIITGGESKQHGHDARPYHVEWAMELIRLGDIWEVPVFVKQMGDNPHQFGGATKKFKAKGDDWTHWPESLRVREMPRIYDDDTIITDPVNVPITDDDLFTGQGNE